MLFLFQSRWSLAADQMCHVVRAVAMARPLVELEERYDFGSLEEFLATSPRLSIFAEALESAGLHGTLSW